MLKFLFILVAAAVGSYGAYYQSASMMQTTIIMHTETLATSTINQLRSDARWVNDEYILPLGVNGTNYHELPLSYAGTRFTRTGMPFIYCPYSETPVVTKDGDIKLTPATSYEINIFNDVSTGGIDYVSASTPSPIANVVAAVISPKNSLSLPSCEDIVVNAKGMYVLTGGSLGKGRVFILHKGQITTNNEATSTFVSTASGGDLDDVMAEISARPMQDHVINLASNDTFNILNDITLAGATGQRRTQVTLRGTDPSKPSTVILSGGLVSAVGIDLVLQNIILSGISIYIEDSEGDFNNVSADDLIIVDSDVEMSDITLENTGSIDALEVYRSKLLLRGGVSGKGVHTSLFSFQDSQILSDNADLVFDNNANGIHIQLFNSEFIQRSGTLDFNSPNGVSMFFVDSLSSLALNNTDVTNSGNFNYGIYAEGRVHIDAGNTNISSGESIRLAPGSYLKMSSATIGLSGTPSTKGIVDGGSLGLSGEADVYASTCFEGAVFSTESVSFADSTVSVVNPDFSIVPAIVNKNVDIDVGKYFNKATIACL